MISISFLRLSSTTKGRKLQNFSFSGFRVFFGLSLLTISLSFIALNTNGYSHRHTDLKSFSQNNSDIQYLNGTNYLTLEGSQCLNRSNLNTFCNFAYNESKKKLYIVGDSMISSLVGGFIDESQQIVIYLMVENGKVYIVTDKNEKIDTYSKVENGKITIAVNFTSEQILDDNEEKILKNKDTWVFEKLESSTEPSWTLVST